MDCLVELHLGQPHVCVFLDDDGVGGRASGLVATEEDWENHLLVPVDSFCLLYDTLIIRSGAHEVTRRL